MSKTFEKKPIMDAALQSFVTLLAKPNTEFNHNAWLLLGTEKIFFGIAGAAINDLISDHTRQAHISRQDTHITPVVLDSEVQPKMYFLDTIQVLCLSGFYRKHIMYQLTEAEETFLQYDVATLWDAIDTNTPNWLNEFSRRWNHIAYGLSTI